MSEPKQDTEFYRSHAFLIACMVNEIENTTKKAIYSLSFDTKNGEVLQWYISFTGERIDFTDEPPENLECEQENQTSTIEPCDPPSADVSQPTCEVPPVP